MANTTLYNFGRANRTGEQILVQTVVPADLGEGILRFTLDVLPNQRADATRTVEFAIEFDEAGQWVPLLGGLWRGNPDTTLMPTEEVPVSSTGATPGIINARGLTVRLRLVCLPSVNVGGTVQWFDFEEAGQARGGT